MKKTIFVTVMLAMVFTAAFAQEEAEGRAAQSFGGVSVTIDIDTDLVSLKHTDVKNDEYISVENKTEPDLASFMNQGKYGDAEIKFGYADPQGDRFGGVISVDFGDILNGSFPLGDLYGYGRVTKYTRFQLGKFTHRTIEKIGGDKDLGVLLFDIDDDGDLAINSSDSFGLGDDAISFLASAYIGPVELNLFVAPDAYHIAKSYSPPGTTGGEPLIEVPAYYSYKAGGSLAFALPDILRVAASYRQEHTGGTGTFTGEIINNYGLYANITALSNTGLGIGAGYSGQIAYDDGDEADTAAVKNAVHVDLTYTGLSGRLNIGLFNNISFYSLEKDKTLTYDPDIAAVSDIYVDESVFVLYNQLDVSYAVTGSFVPALLFKNYYAVVDGRNGAKGQDYGKDIFSVEARANYKITEKAQLRAGIRFENTSYKTPPASQVLKNSSFVIALPVGLTIAW